MIQFKYFPPFIMIEILLGVIAFLLVLIFFGITVVISNLHNMSGLIAQVEIAVEKLTAHR